MSRMLRMTEDEFLARYKAGPKSPPNVKLAELPVTGKMLPLPKPRGRALPDDERAAARQGRAFIKPKKERKYKNRPVYFDRITFASQAECDEYQTLRLLERGGSIRNLVVHPVFPLIALGAAKPFGSYSADFAYDLRTGGKWVDTVVDVKSPVTAKHASFLRNCKIVLDMYGVTVTVVMV